MKETYIKFRCTDEDKATIEAMALKDKEAHNMSEYILNLVRKDVKASRSKEVFAEIMNAGEVVSRVSCGFFLFSEIGRASKDLYKKVEDISKKYMARNDDTVVFVTSEGEKLITNVLSDECWLVK